MTDDRKWPDDVELRRIVMREIAHCLRMFYGVETQLTPRLQAFRERLDQAQNAGRLRLVWEDYRPRPSHPSYGLPLQNRAAVAGLIGPRRSPRSTDRRGARS